LRATTQPGKGTTTVNPNETITYKPNANANGPDNYGYTVSDSDGQTSTAKVYLQITPVNDAPTADNDSYGVDEDGTLNVGAPGILGDDTDVDDLLGPVVALTAAVVNGPNHGTLTLNGNGWFTYTPDADYNGSDTFTYRTNDGTLNSNLATVTLNVSAVNDAPSFELPANPNQIVNEGPSNGSTYVRGKYS
jgi:large repetitive protein